MSGILPNGHERGGIDGWIIRFGYDAGLGDGWQSLGLDLSGYGGMMCLVLQGGFLLLALGGRGLGFTWVSVR